MLCDLQELDEGVSEKSVLVCALEATGQSIQEEMDLKSYDPGTMPSDIASVRSRWEELRKSVEQHTAEVGESAGRFDAYLTSLTGFVSWLDEFHGKLYDEVCIQLPAKASDELISRHKNQLEVLRAEVVSKEPALEEIRAESGEWAEHLVPEVVMADLPSPSEPSPAPDGEWVWLYCPQGVLNSECPL